MGVAKTQTRDEALSVLLTPRELKDYHDVSPEAHELVLELWKQRVAAIGQREEREYRVMRFNQFISLATVVLTLTATVVTAIATKEPAQSSLILGGQALTVVGVSLSNRRNIKKLAKISENIPAPAEALAAPAAATP